MGTLMCVRVCVCMCVCLCVGVALRCNIHTSCCVFFCPGYVKRPWARLNIKTVLFLSKIRWSRNCLIFNMGISILVRGHMYILIRPSGKELWCSYSYSLGLLYWYLLTGICCLSTIDDTLTDMCKYDAMWLNQNTAQLYIYFMRHKGNKPFRNSQSHV